MQLWNSTLTVAFTQRVFEYSPKWLQRCFSCAWLVPRETAAISAHVLCTPYNHAPVYSVTLFEATCVDRAHVWLAVTCRLHFGQNDRDLLRATGLERIPEPESAQKAEPRRRRFSCLDWNPRPFDHESELYRVRGNWIPSLFSGPF